VPGATLWSGACSSEEERRPSKPLVGGSNPSRRIFVRVAERVRSVERDRAVTDVTNAQGVLSSVLSSKFVSRDNASRPPRALVSKERGAFHSLRNRLRSVAMRQLAALALSALTPLTFGSYQPRALDQERAALEVAVFQYETGSRQREWSASRPAQVQKVECLNSDVPPFRGHLAFRCEISYKVGGKSLACYALVGKALYQVGGCFDPMRDLGIGKGRLLSRV
jgi:hypothetical protein